MTTSERLDALRERPARIAAELDLAHGVVYGILICLALLLGVQLWQSLQWRMAHDAAVVQYGAYLIDRQAFVPYRDLFDTVLPGAYLFHLAIGKTLGYGDFAFRLVDLLMLLGLLFVTWQVQRPFGKLVAWSAALLFGLIYLSYGPIMSLQRDYLGLLPIATALLIASQMKPGLNGTSWRYVLIGALFGVTVSIKPHLILGLPVVLLLAMLNSRSGRPKRKEWLAHTWRPLVLALGGLLATAVIPIMWVWRLGGLPALADIFSHYIPLYLQLNGDFKALGQTDRLIYLFTSLQKLGGYGLLLAPAALGGYMALFESHLTSQNKRLAVTLLTLTGVYLLYPALAGQFWNYHWMPFVFFASLSASLVLIPFGSRTIMRTHRSFAAAVFAVTMVLTVRPAPDFYRQLMGNLPRPPADGRVDSIATFLQENLRPGDRVQPLDFVSGGVNQALLLANGVIATRYQFDAQLYNHVSSPYTQARQQDFLSQLQATPPRYIVEYPDRPLPSGPDTIQSLPELEQLISERYKVVQEGSGYLIYELSQ